MGQQLTVNLYSDSGGVNSIDVKRKPTNPNMAKLILKGFIYVYRLLLPEMGFKRSALAVERIRILQLRGREFPKGGLGRQISGDPRSRS